MRDDAVTRFELRVKSVLEWAALDAKTRETLKTLMAEVGRLAAELSQEKRA